MSPKEVRQHIEHYFYSGKSDTYFAQYIVPIIKEVEHQIYRMYDINSSYFTKEDYYHEIYCLLDQHKDKILITDNPRGYLYVISRNLLVSNIRKATYRKGVHDKVTEDKINNYYAKRNWRELDKEK